MLSALVVTLALSSQHGITTEVRKLAETTGKPSASVSKLEASGPLRIRVMTGEASSFVEVTTDPMWLPKIKTSLRSDTIVIETEGEIASARDVIVVVHMPRLQVLKVTGQIVLESEVKGQTFDVTATGACKLTFTGEAKSASFQLSGATNLNALGFALEEATLVVGGANEIQVQTSRRLNIDGGGVANISVRGTPMVRKNATGIITVKNL